MLSISAVGVLSNTAEISTGNLRSGSKGFDAIKATWGQTWQLKTRFGDFNSNVRASYDSAANSDFLKDVDISVDLVEGGADDFGVVYTVSHDFVSKESDVELKAVTTGLEAGWKVKAKAARLNLMQKLGKADAFSAQVDYEGGAMTYEMSYDRNIDPGKDLKMTFRADSKNVDIDYADATFEKGATWTASTSVGLDDATHPLAVLDAAKITVKRSWNW